jgi:membrane protease YdiL (CAAX protease family)
MIRPHGALLRYVLVAYGVTWLLWFPVALASYGLPSFSNPYVSTWFGDFLAFQAGTPAHWLVLGGGVLGPLTGALLAWHHLAGTQGLRTLGFHLFHFRISDWKGWLGAFLPLVYYTLGSLVLLALSGVAFTSELGPLQFMGWLVAGCLLITGEELGWRGTQLPLLQETSSALFSSFVVALTWAFWHIPLLLMWHAGPESSLLAAGLALIPYLLLTIPMAMMHTFAFNSARGLILVSIVLHGLHNQLNAFLSSPTTDSEAALARAAAISGPVLLITFPPVRSDCQRHVAYSAPLEFSAWRLCSCSDLHGPLRAQRTSHNKVLPAPRPLRVRSDLHGPRLLWRVNGVARILRQPVCEPSGGGPRRQHKNVI